MESLISLLGNEKVSKEDLMLAMDKIKFCTINESEENKVQDSNSLASGDKLKHSSIQQAKGQSTIESLNEHNNSRDDSKGYDKKARSVKNYSRNECISKGIQLTENKLVSYIGSKKGLTASFKSFQQSDFWNRYELYQSRKETNHRKRITEVKEQESKECSFKPKLNAQPRECKHFSYKESSERLYSEAQKQETMKRLKAQVKEKEIEDIEKNCTFRPAINSSLIDSRYMNTSNSLLRNDSLKIGETECTFSPEVNKIKKLTKQFNEYLSINPYMRLANKRNVEIKSFESLQESKKPQDVQVIRKKFNDFYLRQSQYELRKEKNKETIYNATHIEPQPKINKKSKEIVKSLVDTKQKTKTINKEEANFTFSPEILPESKKRPKKTLDELVYMPLLLKENKLKRMRESIKEIKVSSPKSKSGKTEAKLRFADHIDTLMEQMKKDKCKKSTHLRRLKENEEMRECTHRPMISRLPKKGSKVAEKKVKYSYSKKNLQ
jgi:hypothetical protein